MQAKTSRALNLAKLKAYACLVAVPPKGWVPPAFCSEIGCGEVPQAWDFLCDRKASIIARRQVIAQLEDGGRTQSDRKDIRDLKEQALAAKSFDERNGLASVLRIVKTRRR